MGWSAYRKTGLTFHNPNLSVKGYTLFSPLGADALYLINMAGQIVKRWKFSDFEPQFGQLLPGGTVMVSGTDQETIDRKRRAEDKDFAADLHLHMTRMGGGFTQLREYDFEGNLLWSYDNPAIHHDFQQLESGNLLVPEWVALPDDLIRQIKGGIRDRKREAIPMLGDDIIEINRAGQEVARYHTWQMFHPKKDPIQPLTHRSEWTHLNSVDRAADGQLIISCRHNSRVALINPAEQKISWKYGEPEISCQHHATAVPQGNIQIFDNGMNRPSSLPYSRIIEVDPTSSTIVWEYKAQPQEQFFSGHISGAQRLEMGNVLICEGTAGRLFEVTRRGEVVWEWITPFVGGSPDGHLMTWIYRAYRYGLDHPAVANQRLDPDDYKQLNRELGLL